jgi:hypothetical protein
MPNKAEIKQIWRCSYCNRPFMLKSSCVRHEIRDCRHSESPRVKSCNHEWDTVGKPISGEEHRYEIDYDFCVKCGLRV